jgi:hypothetical protein
MRLALLIAALLCAAPAAAQEDPSPPQDAPPLSKEDEELIGELALLEQLELVRNLDLFEAEKDPEK